MVMHCALDAFKIPEALRDHLGFYALKLPILHIKFGEKMVLFSLNLRNFFPNFQQITKETFLALARQKNSKIVIEFPRASAPLC